GFLDVGDQLRRASPRWGTQRPPPSHTRLPFLQTDRFSRRPRHFSRTVRIRLSRRSARSASSASSTAQTCICSTTSGSTAVWERPRHRRASFRKYTGTPIRPLLELAFETVQAMFWPLLELFPTGRALAYLVT